VITLLPIRKKLIIKKSEVVFDWYLKCPN
jgi:hypothetical protein